MLHWNYTYIGDGTHYGGALITNFIEQIIGFNNTSQPSIQVLVKRTGQNGVLTLELPMPAPFNGRVGVISSNSTLVIHDLQYNDSSYQFSSNLKATHNIGFGPKTNKIYLKPIVSITINGMRFYDFVTYCNGILIFDIYYFERFYFILPITKWGKCTFKSAPNDLMR